MPALDAGIHVLTAEQETWMAGTSPAMTAGASRSLEAANKPNGISPSGFLHGFLRGGSVDPIDDGAIDDESHRPQGAVVQAGEESLRLEIADVDRIGQA
jgi:hypothetical protein